LCIEAKLSFRLDLASWVHDDLDDTVRQSAFLRGYDLDADVPLPQLETDLSHLATSKLLLSIQSGLAPPSTQGTKDFHIFLESEMNPSPRYQTIGDLTIADFAEAKLAIDLRLAGIGIETVDWHAPQASQSIYNDPSVETENEDIGNQGSGLLYLKRGVPREEKKEDSDEKGNKIATIRSLLAQWQPGTDPAMYAWPGLTAHATGTRLLAQEEEVDMPVLNHLQGGPPVLELQTQPQPLSQHRQIVAHASSQSQGLQEFASTQILPGPFANRQPISTRRGLGKTRTMGF
jgi:hypothetical protein